MDGRKEEEEEGVKQPFRFLCRYSSKYRVGVFVLHRPARWIVVH